MKDTIKENRDNYSAWNISLQEIELLKTNEDWVSFLLKFAVLAPSSHNSQPWLFEIDDKYIKIYKNVDKQLVVGDPENRLMFISIGCAIQNIKIVADYCGINIEILYSIDINEELVATIILGDIGFVKNDLNHLANFITQRSTNRSNYLSKEIPQGFFDDVKKFKNLTNIDLSVDWFFDKYIKKDIGEISSNSSVEVMDKPGFKKELSHYIKNNLTRSKYGIPAFGMSIPTLFSFIVPVLIRFLNMDRLSKKQNIKLFSDFTPVVGVISVDKNSKQHWVLIGEMYEFIALCAEKYNLKTSVWGAPTVLCPEIALPIESKKFHFIFRIGFPSKNQPHSPRHTLYELLKN